MFLYQRYLFFNTSLKLGGSSITFDFIVSFSSVESFTIILKIDLQSNNSFSVDLPSVVDGFMVLQLVLHGFAYCMGATFGSVLSSNGVLGSASDRPFRKYC